MARSVQFESIGDAVRRLLTEEFVIDRLKARTSVRYTNTPSGLHRHSMEIPAGNRDRSRLDWLRNPGVRMLDYFTST